MRNHWSCTKLADWIRGTTKIKVGTGKEWGDWEQAAKDKHPIRWWIAEEGLDKLQDIWLWIPDRLNDIRYYINNRWVSKTHALTAHPQNIKPGTWCDVGNRFLPCLFNELVDFVEVEQAWHHVAWDKEARAKYNTPWWRRGWLRWRAWRCPAAGLAYLDWASTLVCDDSWGLETDSPDYGKPTYQALAAQEIKELYTWWKEVYPNRPDPYDASGWSAYCELRRDKGYAFLDLESGTSDEKEIGQQALDKLRQIEEAYEQEEDEMLIRLIKVRRSLWT